MNTFKIASLRALGAIATLAIAAPAMAAGPHWDRPSCYVHVHDGCYNNTNSPCSDDEYQGFLDNCDQTYPNKPVRRALKLSAVLVSGTVLVFAGFGAGHVKEEMRQIAEQRAEAEAERQRQTDEANREVEALVREAESLLEAGQAEQAVNTLSEAMEISKASNRHLASHLQTKIADSSDPERLFEIVVSLPNAAFDELKDTGATSALDFGFEVLNDRATELVEPQLVRAGEVRAARERERITAAEARRKREAEERERQRLAEEARRAEELARQGEERARAEARREQAQQEVQDRLDAYLAVLALAEVDVVERVSVQRISGNIWEATLTVKNIWHVRHKQLRLQDAQALWEAWAVIASPDAPDSARIKIVDLRGNPVGGSRVWAGSLIWVDD